MSATNLATLKTNTIIVMPGNNMIDELQKKRIYSYMKAEAFPATKRRPCFFEEVSPRTRKKLYVSDVKKNRENSAQQRRRIHLETLDSHTSGDTTRVAKTRPIVKKIPAKYKANKPSTSQTKKMYTISYTPEMRIHENTYVRIINKVVAILRKEYNLDGVFQNFIRTLSIISTNFISNDDKVGHNTFLLLESKILEHLHRLIPGSDHIRGMEQDIDRNVIVDADDADIYKAIANFGYTLENYVDERIPRFADMFLEILQANDLPINKKRNRNLAQILLDQCADDLSEGCPAEEYLEQTTKEYIGDSSEYIGFRTEHLGIISKKRQANVAQNAKSSIEHVGASTEYIGIQVEKPLTKENELRQQTATERAFIPIQTVLQYTMQETQKYLQENFPGVSFDGYFVAAWRKLQRELKRSGLDNSVYGKISRLLE